MIALHNIGYGYGRETLLANVDLRLAAGSFHFLTGPSGAGKTTLLRLCYLDLAPSEGRLEVFGHDAAGLSRDAVARARRRIGVVHQDCHFLDHLPLWENVTLPLTVSGGTVDRDSLRDLLKWVGLVKQANQYPPELSGGERQRAALARAVILSPEVILCDEPTGNVDWAMSERILSLLIELNKMGKTVLVATHDRQLIRTAKEHVATRVLRIRDHAVELAGAEL